jgi:hypothetical protein
MIVAEVSAEVHQEKAMIEGIAQDIPANTIHRGLILMEKEEHINSTPVSEEEISKTNNLMTTEAATVLKNTKLDQIVDIIPTSTANPRVDLYSKS